MGTEIWRLEFLDDPDVPLDVEVPFVRKGEGARSILLSAILLLLLQVVLQ